MAAKLTITDSSRRDFNNTLRRYVKINHRAISEILNNKGLDVAAESLKRTKRAEAEKIKQELGAESVSVIGKSGRALKRKRLQLQGDKYWSHLAVVLVIAKLRKAGDNIPDAEKLKELAVKLVADRLRTIGYIASGWIPAIRRLSSAVKRSNAISNPPKLLGRGRGGVEVARASEATLAKCIIRNSTGDSPHHAEGVRKYGQPAHDAAFKAVTKDMQNYIERKMRGAAHEAGIKTK